MPKHTIIILLPVGGALTKGHIKEECTRLVDVLAGDSEIAKATLDVKLELAGE